MPAVTLTDVLRHVPGIFDFVVGHSLRSLLGTNRENRSLAKMFVSGLRLESPATAYQTLEVVWLTLKPYERFLRVLNMSGCNPSADPVMAFMLIDEITTSSLPNLRHLALGACGLCNVAHIDKLSKGVWPQLEYLGLYCPDQYLCPESTVYLVQANWPLLQVLRLNGHLLTGDAFANLTQHEWPWLETLDLGGQDTQCSGKVRHRTCKIQCVQVRTATCGTVSHTTVENL